VRQLFAVDVAPMEYPRSGVAAPSSRRGEIVAAALELGVEKAVEPQDIVALVGEVAKALRGRAPQRQHAERNR
jgi:hypothetical protein